MKEISVSVRFLVEQSLMSGDLSSEGSDPLTPLEGLRAHQSIQKSRPGNYRSEVHVSNFYEIEDYQLKVQGRLDGIFTDQDRTVVEEIKSTRRDLEFFKKNENPAHWGQAKIYSFLIAEQEGLKQIDTQLTYFNVDSRKSIEIRKEFSYDELSSFFQTTAADWVRWRTALDRWLSIRNQSLAVLEFPFDSYRPGQREMAISIYRAVRDKKQLLIQAPTGIGKTMGALFPVLKTQAENLVEKSFYLTARTTGKGIAEKALVTLRQRGARVRSVTLTAKDKICFNPDKACEPDECEFARGYYDRLADARWALIDQEHFDRPRVEEVAREYRLCPFELSLDISNWADYIISDYNYAFDPRVYLRRHFEDESSSCVFIVDEAHNLVDRSREMYSAELEKNRILEIRRMVKKEAPTISKKLSVLNSWLLKKAKTLPEGESASKEAPTDFLNPLRKFLLAAEEWLASPKSKSSKFRKDISETFFEFSWFTKVLDGYDKCYTSCFHKMDRNLKIKLFCMDPSSRLEQTLNRCRSAVFFSATLTPQDYFRQLFGCRTGAEGLILPSPFQSENLCTVIHQGISTTFHERTKSKDSVASSIAAFINHEPGKYLAFFPSYKYLEMVRECIEKLIPDIPLLIQDPGMAEGERDAFLEQFSAENEQELLGLAVLGGAFGEGIDLVGNQLKGAVVVGVGLPAICLERELIRDYFTETERNGFDFSYRFPGINRVLQAAGRVIRTETDRGAILLIGKRFTRFDYRRLLPKEWRIRQVHNEQQISQVLTNFWTIR